MHGIICLHGNKKWYTVKSDISGACYQMMIFFWHLQKLLKTCLFIMSCYRNTLLWILMWCISVLWYCTNTNFSLLHFRGKYCWLKESFKKITWNHCQQLLVKLIYFFCILICLIYLLTFCCNAIYTMWKYVTNVICTVICNVSLTCQQIIIFFAYFSTWKNA